MTSIVDNEDFIALGGYSSAAKDRKATRQPLPDVVGRTIMEKWGYLSGVSPSKLRPGLASPTADEEVRAGTTRNIRSIFSFSSTCRQ